MRGSCRLHPQGDAIGSPPTPGNGTREPGSPTAGGAATLEKLGSFLKKTQRVLTACAFGHFSWRNENLSSHKNLYVDFIAT